MTVSSADRSAQRTIVIVRVAPALLVLPFAGTLHCEVAHAADGHASAPLTEVCYAFLCLTALVSAVVIRLMWVSIAHAALDLKPMRLTHCLTRWVPLRVRSVLSPNSFTPPVCFGYSIIVAGYGALQCIAARSI